MLENLLPVVVNTNYLSSLNVNMTDLKFYLNTIRLIDLIGGVLWPIALLIVHRNIITNYYIRITLYYIIYIILYKNEI